MWRWLCASLVLVGFEAQAAPVNAPAKKDQPFAFLGELGQVMAATERYYVEPVERQQLLEGALRGMIGKLDPHSAWLDKKEYAELLEDTEGKFGGIGIEVDLRGEQVTVIAPIEGGPSERAGIKSGDRILAVDGQSLEMIGLEKLVSRLRGAPGTKVTLLVIGPAPKANAQKAPKADPPKPRTVQITREVIHVPSVSKKLLTEDVLYVRLKQFQEGSHLELVKAVAALRTELAGRAPRGVLLDLRSNPGGLVNEAVEIADEFMDGGTVLTMRARGRITEEVRASRGGALLGVPAVVLMNEWSASAAELLAGALQDSGVARVVGANSFGKGSVQTILELAGGSALKLTTARYFTPKGHAVQADGIHPDRVAVAKPEDPSTVLPIVRERDLPGALPGDGTAHADRAPHEDYKGQPGEYAVPRDTPVDPRKGDDGVLKIAFEELLRMPMKKR